MPITYLDQEIASFVQERKPLPSDWRNRVCLRSKRGHDERQLDIVGEGNSEFRIILRRNQINQLDFSVILTVRSPSSNQFFRLRRCNGNSHPHTNTIENETFDDFHIHLATERYQQIGAKEDAYAQTTDRYSDYQGALACMIHDANLVVPNDPDDPQGRLFEPEA